MSQENVEIVRRMWKAWDRRDMQALFGLYDRGIVFESHAGPAELRGVYHGHEGVRHAFREWMEPFDDFQVQAATIVEAGDHVVVGWRQCGRGTASGADVDVAGWQVCEVQNGLVTRIDLFETEAEALEAVGLSE